MPTINVLDNSDNSIVSPYAVQDITDKINKDIEKLSEELNDKINSNTLLIREETQERLLNINTIDTKINTQVIPMINDHDADIMHLKERCDELENSLYRFRNLTYCIGAAASVGFVVSIFLSFIH